MKFELQTGWLVSVLRSALSFTCLLCVAFDAQAQLFSRARLPVSSSATTAQTLESASLQTITEQELFKLRRAKEFAAEGDSLSAIALWQSVLDRAGSQLMTREEWRFSSARHQYPKYVTVAKEIESILSGLSEDALAIYRIQADGGARAILSNPGDRSRTEVLSEVVRRFFASSLGDDAAFELACLRLDRYEFTDASRLLRKCLEEHPDCSIPRNEVLLRLAVADGRLGDSKAAEKALSKLSLSDDPRVALVRKDVTAEGVSAGRIARHDAGDWLSKYGTSDRAATMPAVPENAFPNELSELWSYNFDLHVTPEPFNPNQAMGAAYTATGFYSSSLYAGNTRSTSKNSKNRIERRSLVDKWTQCGRTPVGGLLLFEGMVYFKSENRVVCCDADSGEMVWMGIENAFEVDPATRQQLLLSASMPVQTSGLRKPEELQLFADQIFQAMSIGEGNLYSVEGPSVLDPAPVQVQKTPNVYAYAMTVPTRSRQNWLAAYDARNGKLRWRRGAREVEVDGSKFDVGFSCAPVSGAGLTYVTVNETGSIWLLALNPTDGSTVYRTYLCDEPAGSCNPWATTGVAYAEGDVYVATGAGIVAAVDGVSGALRWVVRYERSGDVRKQPSPFGMQMSISKPTGWQDDVVVAAGRSVIVMGSDSDEIFALDRRTGEVLWDSPRNSNRDAEYYLGMSGSRLYVGAYDLVRCYDSIGGRVIWEAEIEGSAGTGIATNEAIYVPTQSSIVKLSLAEGTELARSHFKTMTREPVGNLYSDGNRLFGVGAARTYAFADLQERLSDLEERVTEGEAEATLERARFLCFQGKPDAAWEDLRAAYRLLKEPSNASAFRALTSEALKRKKLTAIELACDVVLQLLDELGLPSSTPKETLAQLLEMRSDLASSDSKAVSKNLVLRCDSCLARSLASIHFSERDGLAQQVISVAKFCDRSHLNKRARQAIETTSSASDLELLRDALKSDHASTREIAVAGLANLDKVGAEVLTSYLKQDVLDSLKLEIAIALLNANESYGLVALGELLETDDVDLRSNALSALVAVTGREKDDDLGEKEIADWQQWIESNYGSAKLTLPYVPLPEPRGRTLVCYLNGVVEEFDLNGRSTWKITIKGPAAACGCSNGHRLVASMQQKTVTEYDESGKSVWNISVDGHPSRVYRLDNGNTLVAMQQPGMVCEYRNDGSVAWKYASSSGVLDARRMENGNTLVTLQDGRILQVRPSGESVWNLSGLSRPVSAQPLRNGNFLIAVSGDNAVVEYDSKQHIVWTRGSMNGILDAMRLPDGNTLVTKQTGVALYSPDGTSLDAGVPKRSSNNNPFSVNVSGSYISRQSGQQVANRIFRY